MPPKKQQQPAPVTEAEMEMSTAEEWARKLGLRGIDDDRTPIYACNILGAMNVWRDKHDKAFEDGNHRHIVMWLDENIFRPVQRGLVVVYPKAGVLSQHAWFLIPMDEDGKYTDFTEYELKERILGDKAVKPVVEPVPRHEHPIVCALGDVVNQVVQKQREDDGQLHGARIAADLAMKQLADKITENAELKLEIKTLTGQKRKADETLADRDAKIAKLEADVKDATSEELKTLKRRLTVEVTSRSQCEDGYQRIKVNQCALKKELEKTKKELNDLQAVHQKLLNTPDTKELEDLKRVKGELEESRASVDRLTATVKSGEEHHKRMEAKVADQEKTIAFLESSKNAAVAEASKVMSNAEKEVNSLRQFNITQSLQLGDLRSQLDKFKANDALLHKLLGERTAELNALKKERESEQKNLAVLNEIQKVMQRAQAMS